MPHWIHFAFKSVWLISALVFARFAYDAHESISLTLPRYQHRISPPRWGYTEINGLSTKEIIEMANGIADTHDKSVEELERSIHQSATLSYHLNSLCCFMALIGLATQFGQYLHDHHRAQKRGDKQPSDTHENRIAVIESPNSKGTDDTP